MKAMNNGKNSGFKEFFVDVIDNNTSLTNTSTDSTAD